MTKEEILQTELDKINKGNTTEIQFCYQAIFNSMESYAASRAKEEAIEFCLKVCGELKIPKNMLSYNEDSNESFLMNLPATIDKRYELFKSKP